MARGKKNMSLEIRNLILDLKQQGLSSGQISKKLKEDYDYLVTRFGVYKFLQRQNTVNNQKKPTARVQKFSDGHKQVLNMWMCQNKDLTARDLQNKFKEELNVSFSITTIKRHRLMLKWTSRQKKYCQLISGKNRLFRVNWCLEKLHLRETFSNVIFVDESNVELSAVGRVFISLDLRWTDCHTKLQNPNTLTRYMCGQEYPTRVEPIYVYSQGLGIMDSVIYQKILEGNLLPFVREKFPDGFRLYQDNDSKHKRKSTRQWMEENGVLKM